ncbi:uncharacterized protein ARMOST_14064 [Armillaria ostoyae]|uniref:Uncharacterized protein n=1 Tax=Armillaria ostoyae TaxID=47428 RepID=A0A284RPK6_ARMOS|nr:uncharacterized protein ARMOST_14064 [Armillaria ostoyae]
MTSSSVQQTSDPRCNLYDSPVWQYYVYGVDYRGINTSIDHSAHPDDRIVVDKDDATELSPWLHLPPPQFPSSVLLIFTRRSILTFPIIIK